MPENPTDPTDFQFPTDPTGPSAPVGGADPLKAPALAGVPGESQSSEWVAESAVPTSPVPDPDKAQLPVAHPRAEELARRRLRDRLPHPQWVLLLVALLIAGWFRLPNLAGIPSGTFSDECVLGTNAYSLGACGRDLHGVAWPIFSRVDKAMGIEGILTQPVYQYSLIPFVHGFGLHNWSIRLCSATYGMATVLMVFFVARLIAGWRLGVLAALLLAIAPWHIHFSRIGFEAVTMPFYLSVATYFLFKGFTQPRWRIAAAVAFAVVMYCYPTSKVFVPLLLVGFTLCAPRAMLRGWPWTVAAILIITVLSIPNVKAQMKGGEASTRTDQALIFKTKQLEAENGYRHLLARKDDALKRWALGSHTKKCLYVFGWNYQKYFSNSWLFKDGDWNPRHHVGGMGMCYAFYLPLLLLGLEWLISHLRKPEARYFLVWAILYPVPGSLATGAPHGIRTLNAVPMLEIIAALGLWSVISLVASWRPGAILTSRRSRLAVLGLVLLLWPVKSQIQKYRERYTGPFVTTTGPMWQAKCDKAIEKAASMRDTHDRIFVTNSILNGYLYTMVFGGVDLKKIDWTKSYIEQLKPFKYYIYNTPPAAELTPKDLVLVAFYERAARYPNLTVVEHFPFQPGAQDGYFVLQGVVQPPPTPPATPLQTPIP